MVNVVSMDLDPIPIKIPTVILTGFAFLSSSSSLNSAVTTIAEGQGSSTKQEDKKGNRHGGEGTKRRGYTSKKGCASSPKPRKRKKS